MINIVPLKELTFSCIGEYGIGASACSHNPSFPQYCRITDITDDGRYKPKTCVSIDPSIYPNFADYYLKFGDIVFARTGSIGRNYFYDPADGDLIYAGYLIKFSLDPTKVDPQYVKYYCQTKQYYEWVRNFSVGSTRDNLNAQDFGNMPITLRSRTEQARIIKILSSIDDQIKRNDNMVQKLRSFETALNLSKIGDVKYATKISCLVILNPEVLLCK